MGNYQLLLSEDSENSELEIGGIYGKNDLEMQLQDFIDEYVLCNQCNNPETRLKYSKTKEGIKMKCYICGKSDYIKNTTAFNAIVKILKQDYMKTRILYK